VSAEKFPGGSIEKTKIEK